MTLRADVVVLYFRAGETALRRTLIALRAQGPAVRSILLVDNGSGDGVVSVVDASEGSPAMLTLTANDGYAAGMNAGFAALPPGGSTTLFLTHETELSDGALDALLHCIEDGAVAAGPLLLLPGGEVWSAGGELTWSGRPVHIVPNRASCDGAAVHTRRWLDGAALLVRNDAFREVGGFDTDFFLYWEDVEIGLRLADAGPVVCCLSAEAVQSTNKSPPYLMARGRVLTWMKRRSRLRASMSVVDLAGRASLRALRQPGWASLLTLRVVMQGILDALTGTLDPRWTSWRQTPGTH